MRSLAKEFTVMMGEFTTVFFFPAHFAECVVVANGNPRYVFWNGTGGQPETAAKSWSSELRTVLVEAGLPDGHSHQLLDDLVMATWKN